MSFNELRLMSLVLGEIRYNINPSVLKLGFWNSFFTSMIGTSFDSVHCSHVFCLMSFTEWKERSSNLSPVVLCSLPSSFIRCVNSRNKWTGFKFKVHMPSEDSGTPVIAVRIWPQVSLENLLYYIPLCFHNLYILTGYMQKHTLQCNWCSPI